MSGGTPGNRPRPGRSDVYWRRRVIALAAAIGVLALIAWTLNGALGGAGNAQPAADTTHAGHHHHHPLAATSPTAIATPTPTPTATPTGRAKATDGAKRSTGKHGRNHAGRHAGHSAGLTGAAGACPPGSVVLSLFMPKYHYLAHQTPQFQIDIVSTAARPCSFDVGSKHVVLVIKAGGLRRVWDSADCLRSAGSRVEKLTRGVPVVRRISWDRKTTGTTCRASGPAVKPGTYNGIARSGALRSQSLIFVLAGPGVAVP